ncbi:MAG: hypothetical protein ABIO29_03490 [Sphingomicrobium sp.]
MSGGKSGPPRLPFLVTVGVTGHRAEALETYDAPAIARRMRAILETVGETAQQVGASAGRFFRDTPPELRLLSPIADGADQIAAECALDLGWDLQVVLPFARVTYRASLSDGSARKRFDQLVERASAVLELTGDGSSRTEGYVMAGRATVAHCDLLLAVWDGEPARGPGGTGDVVQLALTRGTGVIHCHPEEARTTELLWSAFDPEVLTLTHDVGVVRPFDRANLEIALRGLLLPPPDADEARFLAGYYGERRRRIRTRIEYPLMLAMAGVSRFGAKDFRERHFSAQSRDEWQRHRSGCGDARATRATADLLEEAYNWADSLAAHFAQTYRSGHIFGFILGGLAVCIGLSAFMAPWWKMEFAGIELVITFAIILNAWVGTKQEWHRRWLDYRQLAERLRPMRSLKLLGLAAPDPQGTATNPTARRWIEFYASSVWRAIGCPTAALDKGRAAKLAIAIADYEVAPQVAYHRRNAERVEKLDQRLETVGFALFLATLVISLATVVGMAIGAQFIDRFGDWFTLVSAGFPALGTAVFGIRFQADFGGDALRSMATAATLGRIDEEMRRDVTLPRAADLTEQAARVMLADLDEWRLVNQQRELEFG